MFGIVLRVQQILHFLPASLTNLFVFVAIPEICDKKFKATLSTLRMFSALPSIVAIISFFLTIETSFFFILILFF